MGTKKPQALKWGKVWGVMGWIMGLEPTIFRATI